MIMNFTVDNYRNLIIDLDAKIEDQKKLLRARRERIMLSADEDKYEWITKLEDQIRGMELLKDMYMNEYLKMELLKEAAV